MRKVTRDQVADSDRLFRLLSDMSAQVDEVDRRSVAPPPPSPREPKPADSILTGVRTPGGAQIALGITELATRKHNLDATVDPTTADDNSQGYARGSVWINTASGPRKIFMLADATTTAADWKQIG